ncbi:MAG TPA: hypothetical protein VLT79_13000 [Gemmatimonadales bacterium]|nr:hypothetical protein [Gemmatimonadales bacterium]
MLKVLAKRFAWCACCAFTPVGIAAAQNPDLALSPAERDSILATYHQTFPILGRQAIQRGFQLPLPVGLNVNSFYMNQGIALSQLGLSVNDNPPEPSPWITLGEARSRVTSLNIRADLWVLPFLNVYGFGGNAWANTKVPVTEPVSFTSEVSQTGVYGGIGLTGTIGIRHNWLAGDVNWSWTDLEKLDQPVRGRILSFRLGKTWKLNARQRVNFWIGTSNQKLVNETNGTVTLAEAIPPAIADSLKSRLANYQSSDWYQNLTPVQKRLADSLVAGIANANLGATRVNYSLTKAPADPWNMLVGGTYELNRHWHFRGEVGFFGRVQALLVLNYRFGL